MKIIPLSQGLITIVSDEDFEYLSQWKWYAAKPDPKKNKWYARRMEHKNGKDKLIYMHRIITNCPDGLEPDHVNHNTLDNRRENLRVGTHTENMWNSGKHKRKNATTKYIGVGLFRGKQYQAQIAANGNYHYLGLFKTAEEAARAYDEAARTLRGSKTTLNFPDEC